MSVDASLSEHSTEPGAARDGKPQSRHLLRWVGLALIIAVAIPIIRVTMLPPAAGFDGYNYSSYRQVGPDSADPQGPNPGEPFPDSFSVYDLNGSRINLAALWSDKPLVLEFGSVSCPIFHGNGPSMEDIYQKYDGGTAAQAYVGLLYVREAHPGWFRSPHARLDDKLATATLLRDKGLTRTIWVDDVDGELHQRLGPEPNSVYIINTDGNVIYKSAWNAPTEVDRVLDRLVNAGITPAANDSNYCTDPRPYYEPRDYLAYIARIAMVGGPDALADFIINLVMNAGDEGDEADVCNVVL